jgi:dCMP deaminase
MNAILTAHEPVRGYTIYLTGEPCVRCAMHLIQAGIARVVFPPMDEERKKRWDANLGLEMLKEAGVKYEAKT